MNIPTDNFATAGSQRWLQIAVNKAPTLLLDALRPALQLDSSAHIEWCSPLQQDDNFCEYRDEAALEKIDIRSLPVRPLRDFWPQRGPVWDALGRTSDGQFIFVEAKAHFLEAKSPPSSATSEISKTLIQDSLAEARSYFAPNSQKDWSQTYYQYANRLAHHYLFHKLNGLRSHMIFLYFVGATEMNGPKTKEEWEPTIAQLHSALGLEKTDRVGVHEIFFDVSPLKDLV